MKKESAGGAATNAGSEYQQRVSSLFLVCMLLRVKVSDILGLPSDGAPIEVSFETQEPIDDCRVTLDDGTRMNLQIKRSISLSEKTKSDFYSVIDQFVQQYLSDKDRKSRFILATSSRSSSSITRILKKILESTRSCGLDFESTVLNEKEISVYNILKNVIKTVFNAKVGFTITDTALFQLLARTHVEVFDIEQGDSLERAILTLLATKSSVSPTLVWHSVLSNALRFSSSRMTVSHNYFLPLFEKYLKTNDSKQRYNEDNDFFEIGFSGEFSCGRDVVLLEGPNDSVVVMEFYRFDEMGRSRIKYENGFILLENGLTGKLIRRFATFAGLERYVKALESVYSSKKVTIVESKIPADYEDSEWVLRHKEYCHELIRNNHSFQTCIHCGARINERQAVVVEVDYMPRKDTIGLVHKGCINPMDRILGSTDIEFFKRYEFLDGFDIATWVKYVVRGQGLINGVESHISSMDVVIVGWNGEATKRSGNYCIKVLLKDGDARYVLRRGKIDRMQDEEARSQAVTMNNMIASCKITKDPLGYTSETGVFGKYSLLLRTKRGNEKIVEAVTTEVERYSKLLEIEEQCPEYYSPLVRVIVDEKMVVLKRHVVLLSDPLKLPDFLESWRLAGTELHNVTLDIIKDDIEFDSLVEDTFLEDLGVVIDPVLDQEMNLVKGYIIKDINSPDDVNI